MVHVALLSYVSKQPTSVGRLQSEKKKKREGGWGVSVGATTLLKQHSFLLDNGPLKVLIGG